jgi:hypothetical protein
MRLTSRTAIAARVNAIAARVNAIAVRVHALAVRVHAIAVRVHAIAVRVNAIAARVNAIAARVNAIAVRVHASAPLTAVLLKTSQSKSVRHEESLRTLRQASRCNQTTSRNVPSVFGRNLQCEPVRNVDTREECH